MCRLCNQGAITTNIRAGHLLWCCCHLSALRVSVARPRVCCGQWTAMSPMSHHLLNQTEISPVTGMTHACRVTGSSPALSAKCRACSETENDLWRKWLCVWFWEVLGSDLLTGYISTCSCTCPENGRELKEIWRSSIKTVRLKCGGPQASSPLFVAVGNEEHDARAGVHLFQSCLLSTCCHLARQTSTGWRSGNSLQVSGCNAGRVTRYPDGWMACFVFLRLTRWIPHNTSLPYPSKSLTLLISLSYSH
jgi:hypothetical protein